MTNTMVIQVEVGEIFVEKSKTSKVEGPRTQSLKSEIVTLPCRLIF